MVIARNRGLAVHHVTVHAIGEKLSVSLDLEVEGSLTLAAAHEIADALEIAINDELGAQVEVDTHIEPLQSDALGRDAASIRIKEVEDALTALATKAGTLCDIHDVRVRDTSEGRRTGARVARPVAFNQARDRPCRAAAGPRVDALLDAHDPQPQ